MHPVICRPGLFSIDDDPVTTVEIVLRETGAEAVADHSVPDNDDGPMRSRSEFAVVRGAADELKVGHRSPFAQRRVDPQ
jgi:hypothetical protein